MRALGFGVGLRPKHYRDFLERSPKVDFVEAIAENFMGIGGRPRAVLEKVRAERPVVLHGVSLGIASSTPLDERYLVEWKKLIDALQPAVVSDHLCWGRAHRRYAHDLLPIPFTEEAVQHVVERVSRVQDFIGRRLALENVSSYVTFSQSEMTEWEFIREVATRADCELLLDVNNVFVSSRNHHFDPEAYLAGIPAERVTQIHLAGHQRGAALIIDTHDAPVSDEVWALFQLAVKRTGPVSTLIEWDDSIPPLERLLEEAELARAKMVHGEVKASVHARVTKPIDVRTLETTQQVIFEAICEPVEISQEAVALTGGGLVGLDAYAGMYWMRMRDVMRDAFPLTRAASDDFDALVADYLKVHPSTHFSLDRLGASFAAFVSEELSAIASLEWARSEAFIALDAPVAGWSALTAVPAEEWASVVLTLHPSVRLVGHRVVWRQGFEVFDAEVSNAETQSVRRALEGAPLVEVLESFEEDSAGALSALQSWFNEGMVSLVGSAPSRDRPD